MQNTSAPTAVHTVTEPVHSILWIMVHALRALVSWLPEEHCTYV